MAHRTLLTGLMALFTSWGCGEKQGNGEKEGEKTREKEI